MRRAFLVLAAGTALLAMRAGAAPDPRGATSAQLSTAAREITAFRDATGELPRTSEGVAAIVSDPASLTDAWGHDVVYLRVAGGFWLMSFGADGAPGGTGDDEDLVQMAR